MFTPPSTFDRATQEVAAPALPLGHRLLAFAREQLEQAGAHLARDGEARHAGVHQARKCLRRTRAVLALGRKHLGPRAHGIDEDIGRLCRGLSHLRDAQALVEALARLEGNAPVALRAQLPDLIAAARERRDRVLVSTLARDPDFAARRARLRRLRDRLASLTWATLDEPAVVAAVARSERRAERACRRAGKHPGNDAHWHDYRRRLRRLRQQDTLLAELQPGLRPHADNLEERATALGEAQDDALLLRHCGKRSPFPADERALLRRLARERLRQARTLPG